MRYEDTAGGLIRKAFGITEPDRTAVVERAEEIRSLVDKTHRVSLGTGYEMSPESAEAAAAAELAARPLIGGRDFTVAEWNARMRSTDPYWQQDGVMSMHDGVCWKLTAPDTDLWDSRTPWRGGSPQLRAAAAEAERIGLARAFAMASGPLAMQIR